ncbi:hypothetical protein SPBR_03873 [Sporothrix brasiliensis 5110]|uniref:Uncharacterized protein n=1 Tax=Sporothrix brasiliensis 5110 TaxID=1398154 RepID=A0A0C2J6X0_9PEZI|nr:uncharacterized protein SPBR_03873 [Sporothrix brasiliensis 5110]KIH94730.1 hypothetical protein SPBR_03873 [Sporothrix brasiliensis 5110]
MAETGQEAVIKSRPRTAGLVSGRNGHANGLDCDRTISEDRGAIASITAPTCSPALSEDHGSGGCRWRGDEEEGTNSHLGDEEKDKAE